ncbi:hypothetical protein L596_012350 [Steinernema carpocapsae]|uniref:AN1-type domain-containing protein n=1 Tax=Steinernema carpocapsae TaxID=34508 RepID=A0A4U5NWT6_STECR|nr:hypothetical protein L596_012350 [Steinernema carpocapsae]
MSVLCKNGCGFYGSEKFNSYCSKCFNEVRPAEVNKEATPEATAEPETSETPSKSNRCKMCHKKLGLTGISCRCGDVFCSTHRYEKEHNCDFDYKASERDQIKKNNPSVQADKLNKC